MYQNSIKSSTAAGLLGIFLGAFGAHNWYLDDKKKGTIHVSLTGAGFLCFLLSSIILPSAMDFMTLYRMAWLFTILSSIGGLLIAGSEIWGFIEGIQILSGGDAGLAAKGYAVAQPMQPMQQGQFAQPTQQPMQPNQFAGSNNQPVPNQPAPNNQPMQGQSTTNQPLDQSAQPTEQENGAQNG